MMLLTAIILILAFVALTGMVARVAQLGKATARERSNPAMLAVEPMLDGAERAMQQLAGKYDLTDPAQVQAYQDAVRGALEHLQAVYAQQGFWVTYTLTCLNAADPTTGVAELTLDDSVILVTVVTETFPRPNCATVTG
jgi:hypothetical protein